MATHNITLSNGMTGTVTISEGVFSVQLPTATMQGVIKKYDVELTSPEGNKVIFPLHKYPNGDWWNAWFAPHNPDADPKLIELTKQKIAELSI